ncbi:MAG: hypothetical protein Q8P59_14920 [Dehalococcoidia bacterium]|nr:hypothetical protein [Dehalococcoidia bacterium]
MKVVMVTSDRADWRIFLGPGLTSAQQIEGKSMAVSSGASVTFTAKEALRYLRVDPTTVTFVKFSGDENILAGLKAGSVAAASIGTPVSFMAATEGLKVLVDTADIVKAPLAGISTTQKRIQENPGQMKGVKRLPR